MGVRSVVVEIVENFNDVQDYKEIAVNTFKKIDRLCFIDYSLILVDNEIKYKIVVITDDDERT